MDRVDREFDWDGQIENDSSFTLLAEGDYEFTVEKFERARHGGSAKLPPCNKAVMTLRVGDPFGQSTTITHNLFLHSKCEGLLSEFFVSVGMRKRGEKFNMDFPGSIGRHGMCHVVIDTYTGRDGDERKSNKITKFLEMPEAPVQQTFQQAPQPTRSWKDGF